MICMALQSRFKAYFDWNWPCFVLFYRVTQILPIPNVTKRKLHYHVESDLACLSGPANVTVLPGQTGQYELIVHPLKRGHFKGILTFVAGDNPVK